MVFKHLFEGGPTFMVPIFIMWLAVIIMAIRLIVQLNKGEKPRPKMSKQNEVILFIGSFAFLFGVLGQVIGLFEAFEVIQEIGEISPSLIAGALKVSSIAPIYGMLLFLVSSVFWFIFRYKLKTKFAG